MNILKKACCLVILLAISTPAALYAEDDPLARHNLKFETSKSETIIHWGSAERPKYRTAIYLKQPNEYHWGDLLNERGPLFNSLSKEQQNFLSLNKTRIMRTQARANSIITFHSSISTSTDANGIFKVTLYGVTEEDIKAMVKAVIKQIDDRAFAEIEKVKQILKDYRQSLQELEKTVPQLIKEKETVDADFEKLKKTAPYLGIEDSKQSVQEFNRMIQLADIEIQEIRAKHGAVQFQKDMLEQTYDGNPKEVLDFLLQMRLTLEIELAGATKRREMTDRYLNVATRFMTLAKRTAELPGILKLKQQDLANLPRRIKEGEDILADPPVNMQPVELADNKIVIYPITVE
jgi:archaellum component FlaC